MRRGLNKITLLSRHPSHRELRKKLKGRGAYNQKIVIRLGSLTNIESDVEVNSIDSIKNSSDKLLMKLKFDENGVQTAKWTSNIEEVTELEFPIIAKHRFGSRGRGNTKINNVNELNEWRVNKNLQMYIWEEYVPYGKEYRIYCTKDSVFLAARKMLREGENPDQRHTDNSNFLYTHKPLPGGALSTIQNEEFNQPNNWEQIKEMSILAIKSVGLDVGCVDLKVQHNSFRGRVRENPKFIIIETNSAPGCGEVLTNHLYELFSGLFPKNG